MPRIWICVTLWSATVLLGVGSAPAQAVRPSESLLPDTTAAFLAVANVDQLDEQWNKTQLGQLMADPVMKPFTESLRKQFEDRWSRMHERLGLTLDDLEGVPTGEVGAGLILPAYGVAALAIVIDVTGNLPKATELLETVSANLKKQGAKRTLLKQAEYPDPIIFFDAPPSKDDPDGNRREMYYFLSGNVLCATDNLEVSQGILARLAGNQGDSLQDVAALQIVKQRCAKDAGHMTPQLRWFIHPLSYAEVLRISTPEEKRRKGKSLVEVMQNQGVAGVQGVGGFVDFAAEGLDMIHRTAVHAPRPREKALKILEFPNAEEYAPQRWVPRDVATYSTLYCDVLNAFDNFGPLFDELFGNEVFLFSAELKCQSDLDNGVLPEDFRSKFQERRIALTAPVAVATKRPGSVWEIKHDKIYIARKRSGGLRVYEVQTGIWDEVLEHLREEETGPQIDLRKELMVNLGTRVTMVSDYVLPITPTCERLLYAVEATDEKAVAQAIEKLYQNDVTVKKRVVDTYIIWEMVGDEDAEVTKAPVVELPRLMPEEGEEDEEEEEEEEQGVPLLPHRSVTVAHGHLFVASHIEFLKKVLKPAGPRETLSHTIDYRRVEETINQLAIAEQCARMFSRTDEEYRPTYELIRQGKMPMSETLFGRLLNTMFGAEEEGGIRRQRIDGSQLPDYDVARRYLGPAGLVVTSEPDGWFFKGFTLSKESR